MSEPCENGCNGCDDCTDYDYGEPDDDCTYCRGDGRDRYSDYMMVCPMCDGSGKA